MLPEGHPYCEIIQRVLKPGRYTGGEHNAVHKDPAQLRCRIALSYPDAYEIGMSHMGLKILYSVVNACEDLAAERAFAPWPDMEAELREAELPLLSLESASPLSEFDILGFSLQYELTYTNVLLVLELGGIPRRSEERGDSDPLIIAGGPLAFQPEPMSPFIDLFLLGDGEEALPELMREWARLRDAGVPRRERLAELAKRPGCYVPALYDRRVDPLSLLEVVQAPGEDGPPFPIQRAHLADLNDYPFPADSPVAESQAVFDRHGIELARGCTEGCRFCQAGMIYRPVRERAPAQVIDTVMGGIRESGYDEVSLTALSTADYSAIVPLVTELMDRMERERVSLAVSSLRAYGLPEQLLDEIGRVRATSLTFAPEAGTQRLRDVINKNISEEQILESARRVFSREWNHMKLYFMIGLPTETEADVDGIVETSGRVREVGVNLPDRKRRARVTSSVSSFVPKPHTPFQWAAMDAAPVLEAKQRRLHRLARNRGLEIKWHDAQGSLLEGVLSRGDRRVAALVEAAYELGARFDSWDEQFHFSTWREAMSRVGLDPKLYLGTLPVDGRLPWDHLDPGLEPDFLAREYRRSLAGRLSPPCGKPRGAVHQPVDRGEAASRDRKLVCYHCGIACDLDKIHTDRVRFHDELEALDATAKGEAALAPARYRLVFAKRGAATALSHLDMVRLWPRLLRRAGLPVLYSLGYHPHPRLSFTPALPMGMESEGEQVEMSLLADLSPVDLMSRLGAILPEGLEPVACHRDEAEALSKRLGSLIMRVEFFRVPTEALEEACAALLARDSIVVERRRKGRVLHQEFRPTLLGLRPEVEGGNGDRATVIVELGLQGPALKAAELTELLGGDAESVQARRLGFRLKEVERACS